MAAVPGTGVIYSVISVMTGPELNLEAEDEEVLKVRLAVMYSAAVRVCVIVRFECARWRAAMDREHWA